MHHLNRFAHFFWILPGMLLLAGCSEINLQRGMSERNKVASIVENLGKNRQDGQDFKTNVALLHELTPYPQTAVEVLVGELRPVAIMKLDVSSNNSIENENAHHIIWCFRALDYLTGHKILSSSSYKLTDSDIDENRSGLTVTEDGRWAFFTEWMSRGSVYFAPIDAQESIIRGWKKWENQNLKTYSFPQNVNFDEWYFGGPE
jgi:hypothetical protein